MTLDRAETLAGLPITDKRQLRIRRLSNGKIDVRIFDLMTPGAFPTKEGFAIPPDVASLLAVALAAATKGAGHTPANNDDLPPEAA